MIHEPTPPAISPEDFTELLRLLAAITARLDELERRVNNLDRLAVRQARAPYMTGR